MVEVKCRCCTAVFISQDETAALRSRDEHMEKMHRPEVVDWSKRTEHWRDLTEDDKVFLQQARISVK
jgi:hypothetical protein